MSLSAKEAGESVGLTKQGIIKAIREGKISAKKNERGQWEIEPSELFRVYQPINKVDTNQVDLVDCSSQEKIELVDSSLHNENLTLKHRIELLEQQLSNKDLLLKEVSEAREKTEQREKDLSAKLDKAQSTIERQTYLLQDMRDKPSQKPVETTKRFLGIFPYKNS